MTDLITVPYPSELVGKIKNLQVNFVTSGASAFTMVESVKASGVCIRLLRTSNMAITGNIQLMIAY